MKLDFKYKMDVANPAASRVLPRDVPGLVLDLDADVGVTYTVGLVLSSWADQSGNGNNATPGAGSLGLVGLLEDASFAGHASITTNGVNDYLLANGIGGLPAGNPGTVFHLVGVDKYVTLPAAQVTQYCWSDVTITNRRIINLSTVNGPQRQLCQRTDDAGGFVQPAGSITETAGGAHIHEYTCNGTNITVLRDGAVTINNAAFGANQITPTRFTIGGRKLGTSAPSLLCNMSLSRLLVYNNVPSAADQTWLRAYLKDRYETP